MRKKELSVHTHIWTLMVARFLNFIRVANLFKTQRVYTVELIKLYKTMTLFRHFTHVPSVKDLLSGQIRDVDVKQQFTKAKENLEDTVQLALESTKKAKTSERFQKLMTHNQLTPTTTYSLGFNKNPHFWFNNTVVNLTMVEGKAKFGPLNAQLSKNLAIFVVIRSIPLTTSLFDLVRPRIPRARRRDTLLRFATPRIDE